MGWIPTYGPKANNGLECVMHPDIYACIIVCIVVLCFVLVVIGARTPDTVEWQR